MNDGPLSGPASYAQAHRYSMEQAQPDRPQRTLRTAYRVRGALDTDRLEHAFHTVIARHDALRTAFTQHPDGLRYQVLDHVDWRLSREPAVAVDGGPVPPALLRELDTDTWDPFARDTPPLLRARLWPLGTDDWLLAVKTDHMIADTQAVEVLMAEVGQAYRGESFAGPAPSFARWVEAQAAYLDGPDSAADRAYWDSVLAGRPAGWDTPLPDFDVRDKEAEASGYRSRVLPEAVADGVRVFARQHRLTPYMAYLSALAICLVRRTGDPDVCVLGTTANRSRELNGLVGWCAHGLAYRVDVSPAGTPAELALLVRASCLRVLKHQRYPLLRWRLDNDPTEHGRRLRRPYVFLHPITEYFTPPRFAGLATELVEGTAVEADPCLGFLVRRLPSGDMGLGLHYGGFGYDRERADTLLAGLAESVRFLVEQPGDKLGLLPGWPS